MDGSGGVPSNMTSQGSIDVKTKMAAEEWPSLKDGANRYARGGSPEKVPVGHRGMNLVPMPPDGGYGWVIVFACFLSSAIVEGSIGSFGVFLPHFADAFGASRAKTTIAGSLLIGGFLISGVVVSGLINCLGCRIVTMVGAAITSFAFALSTLCTQIDIFVIVYGFIGGLGLAMIYLPSMVMVGYYFEKHRSLATGIAYSGAGIGMLVMAPVTEVLVASYDWRNALMLLAAFPLHALVLGALMRPLDVAAVPDVDEQCESSAEKWMDSVATFGGNKVETLPNTCEGQGGEPYLSRVDSQKAQSLLLLSEKHIQGKVDIKPHCASSLKPFTQSCVELPSDRLHPNKITVNYATALNRTHHMFHRRAKHQQSRFISCEQLTQLPDEFFEQIDMHQLQVEILKPLARRDIFYSGNIAQLPEFHKQPDMRSYIASVTMIPNEDMQKSACNACPCISHSTLMTLDQMLHCRLLIHPLFLTICLASIFIQLGYFIPIVFISDYAVSLGVPQREAAILISVIGLANTVGRASAGALGNLSCVNTLHLNNLSLIVSGVATLLVCLVSKTYTHLVIYATVYGLFIGAFVPLTTIFLVKHLGIHRLNNAVGLLSMVRGVSSMAGPPIAGVLLDSYRTHTPIFYFAGVMFLLAGCTFYLVPFVTKCIESDITSPNSDSDSNDNMI